MPRHGFFAFAIVLLTGCQTPLDIRQTELIQTWGEGNKAFALVIDEYRKLVGKAAENHHLAQRELRDQRWDVWLNQHTQADGGLVFTNDDGTLKPMRAEQLRAAMALRDQASDKITGSERLWGEQDAKIAKAVENFKIMNEVGMSTNEEIAEAKKSAQQLVESALSALAGLSSGFGIGVVVAP